MVGSCMSLSFYVKDRLVCRLFRFGGKYAPRECGQGIPLVLKCRAVLGLWIFGMNPQQNAGGGRSWLIIDGFVISSMVFASMISLGSHASMFLPTTLL